MEGLVKEYENFLNDDTKPESEKFWGLEKRIKEDKRHPGVIMEMRKSEAIWDIARLIRLNVIIYDDLSEFSEDLQREVKRILDMNRQGRKGVTSNVILEISQDGYKEVLTIEVCENESPKYGISVLNGLKNCGVKDILIICAEELTGIKEAIVVAYHKIEYQRCIVHQVRNTMKYVADKDRKQFCTDLKTIYQVLTEEKALGAMERVSEKWSGKYLNSMKSWKQNWDAISPIFKFSAEVRKTI